MRSADVDILIVPGFANSGPDHWQSRWERSLKTARRIEQDDWLEPDRTAWVERIVAAAEAAERPAVLVGHSLGVHAIVHAAPLLPKSVIGAFLVGAPDFEASGSWPATEQGGWPRSVFSFAPMSLEALPFSTRMIASSNDPFCSVERSQALARSWGADLSIIADAGHINTDSGHGPWPEGVLTFGIFLKKLGAARVQNGAADPT